jgi:cytochrome c-type biogenesis protein CcmF
VRQHAETYATALLSLMRRNNRRYGGYIVHFGMVLIFLGITGSAFVREGRGTVGEGESIQVGRYTLRVAKLEETQNANYWAGSAQVEVFRGDRRVASLDPEKRFYIASEQPSSEVAILQTPREDLYLVYSGMNEDQSKAVLQAYVNPLVMWLWIGGLVVIAGTFVCMLPPLRGANAA